MEAILIGIMVLGLLTGGSGGNNTDGAAEIQQQMEEVLVSPEEILTSQPNVTTATQLLVALPDPEERHQVALYNIEDKTGQHKSEGGAVSRVVTQGATEMMVTALKRSRQFTVLDRIRFQDIMNEQNLVSNQRIAQGEGPEIGLLTGADYVISGAITEYQVDKDTGGLGLVIAGKGGSQKYARATSAIDLRVTNTTTGEVVWAESFKGEILGERIGLQVFSFMGQNIVEFETGKGKQEVINLVLRTLIEEAVFQLHTSGVL